MNEAVNSGRPFEVSWHLVETTVAQHPRWDEPKYDWGVEEIWDDCGNKIGEDRSGYKPEWDGKTLREVYPQMPFYYGTTYIQPTLTITYLDQ